MTTNNYQVNVSNVQGNVNIQLNAEKSEPLPSPPGPERPRQQTTWALEAFSLVGLLFIKTLGDDYQL